MAILQHTETSVTVTAASYERVSKFSSSGGFSLGAQEKDATAFAAERGWTLPEHLRFTDGDTKDASGADWDLTGLNAMLDAAKRHEFTVLIVRDPDRFARNMVKALILEEQLRKQGVRVVYQLMPLEDTAEGRLLKNQLHAFAEYEREKIRFRTARGRREKAERGLVVGNGIAPFGYRYVRDKTPKHRVVGLEPDPLTAPIVARIFREAADRSAADITEILRAENVPSPAGRWLRATVYAILANPTYCGSATYGIRSKRVRRAVALERRDDVAFIHVPPIVSPDQWDAVQAAMQRRQVIRKVRYADTEADPYLLRGLLICGHCGGSLATSWNQGGAPARVKFRRYSCLRAEPRRLRPADERCTMRELRAETIEAWAWSLVEGSLLDGDTLREGLRAAREQHAQSGQNTRERVEIVERELRQQRARLGRILEELLDTPRDSESHRALTEKRETTERMIRQLTAEQASLEAAPLPGLSEDEATELLRAAAEIRAGLAKAGSPEHAAVRRWLYQKLRLRITARQDPKGLDIGQRHRFTFEPEAVLPLKTTNGVDSFKGRSTLLVVPGGVLRLRLAAAA